MAVRVLLEELTAQSFPARLDSIHPTDLAEPTMLQRIMAIAGRGLMFYFVAGAIVGPGWHLAVGTLWFILPPILGLYEDRLPNKPWLYQLLPGGLPGFVFSMSLGTAGLVVLVNTMGESANLAQIGFAVLPLPATILAILRMFGREPAEGTIKWSQRPSLRWANAIGGVAILALSTYYVGFM